MTKEIAAVLVALSGSTAAAVIGLWVRFEHRMTVLETQFRLEKEVRDRRHRVSGLSHYDDPLTP